MAGIGAAHACPSRSRRRQSLHLYHGGNEVPRAIAAQDDGGGCGANRRLAHRSRIAFEATSTSGENRYSSLRRAQVLSSTVTAIPDVSGWVRPSTAIVSASG